jgi:hypothetical protein
MGLLGCPASFQCLRETVVNGISNVIVYINVGALCLMLTEEGIKPGTDNLKAVKSTPLPSNAHEVRQFLVLCNSFHSHVRNCATNKFNEKIMHLERKPTAARCTYSLSRTSYIFVFSACC